MQRCHLMCVTLLMVVGGCAGKTVQVPQVEISVEQQFELFKAHVRTAAAIMNVDVPPVVIARNPLVQGDWVSVMVQPLPHISIDTPFMRGPKMASAQILVRPWYLEVENEQAFEHVAYHELCHIKLGHPGTIGDKAEKEFAAARCTFPYVAEDDFYAVLRRIAARFKESPYLLEISQLNEREFRSFIDEQLGLERKEP